MGRLLGYVLAVGIVMMPLSGAHAQNQPKPAGAVFAPPFAAPPSIDLLATGARALGMGRAFIAIADDATAALANPAGLTILERREVAIHGRVSSDENLNRFDNAELALAAANYYRGQSSVIPTPGPLSSADTVARFKSSSAQPSFISGVIPMRNWVLAVFLQNDAQLESSSDFLLDESVFADTYHSRRAVDASVWSLGASGGYAINSEWSVGASLGISRLSMSVFQEDQVDYFDDFEFRTDPASFEHVDARLVRSLLDDEDTALTYGLGLLYSPHEQLDLGFSYRGSGSFELDGASVAIRCTDFPGVGSCDPAVTGSFVIEPEQSFSRGVALPDQIGFGAAWRPANRWTLGADLRRLSYSDQEVGPLQDAGAAPIVAAANANLEPFEDVTELHLGAEYEWSRGPSRPPVFLRAGLFTDSDHDGSRRVDSDQTHLTLGVGFGTRQMQIDFAADFANQGDAALISYVYRFD